eukprot:scaffold221630_cov30-Tisochrysis_lutea.AAC.5
MTSGPLRPPKVSHELNRRKTARVGSYLEARSWRALPPIETAQTSVAIRGEAPAAAEAGSGNIVTRPLQQLQQKRRHLCEDFTVFQVRRRVCVRVLAYPLEERRIEARHVDRRVAAHIAQTFVPCARCLKGIARLKHQWQFVELC